MTISDKTVAVIGGAGFIGSHLVDQLYGLPEPPKKILVYDNEFTGNWDNLSHYPWGTERIIKIIGDIRDYPKLTEILNGVDTVFLLAAIDLKKCQLDPTLGVDVNVGGTLNVLEACAEHGINQLIFSSSASVYGDALDDRMTEKHPFNNKTIYGATKIAGEQFIKAWTYRTPLRAVCLRYMNVYGPRQRKGRAYTDVITKVIENTLKGQRTEIYGKDSIYDFIYVTDVAWANILATSSPTKFGVYNIGCGKGTRIADLVDMILAQMGSDIPPFYVEKEKEPIFVQRRVSNSTKALLDFGFSCSIPLGRGLWETIADLKVRV